MLSMSFFSCHFNQKKKLEKREKVKLRSSGSLSTDPMRETLWKNNNGR